MRKSLIVGVCVLVSLVYTVGAQNYELVKSGDWTMSDTVSPYMTTTDVETWNTTDNPTTEKMLGSANISLYVSAMSVTTTALINDSETHRPLMAVTLKIIDGEGYLEAFTATSDSNTFIPGLPAIIKQEDNTYTYTYLFGSGTPIAFSVRNAFVGFLQTTGAGFRTYEVSVALLDSAEDPVDTSIIKSMSGSGSVEVAYTYSGAPVPEPATGALALAGIVMLFARRRRREA